MRGYYTIIDGKPYQFPTLSLTGASQIKGEDSTRIMASAGPMRDYFAININYGDLTRRCLTNKEDATAFMDHLIETNATSITKLSKQCFVYIEYILVDLASGCEVDHGIAVTKSKLQPFLFPLGLTDEDEYVARFGFEVSASVDKPYKKKYPYMVGRNDYAGRGAGAYKIIVKRAYSTITLASAWAVSPARPEVAWDHKRPKPHRPSQHRPDGFQIGVPMSPFENGNYYYDMPVGIVDPDRVYGPGEHPAHPSANPMAYVPRDIVPNPDEVVVLFDTSRDYRILTEQVIDFEPQNISIGFNFKTLMPILIAEEEVIDTLEQIKREINDQDNPDGPGDFIIGGVDTPLPGDDIDVGGGSEKPEDGSNETDGDGTEEPGNESGDRIRDDSPLTGPPDIDPEDHGGSNHDDINTEDVPLDGEP